MKKTFLIILSILSTIIYSEETKGYEVGGGLSLIHI